MVFLNYQKEHWTYEPFSAHKTENGDIYARGTQVKNFAFNLIYTSMAIEHINNIQLMGGSRNNPCPLTMGSRIEGGGVQRLYM